MRCAGCDGTADLLATNTVDGAHVRICSDCARRLQNLSRAMSGRAWTLELGTWSLDVADEERAVRAVEEMLDAER